jgi:hypothetical protein
MVIAAAGGSTYTYTGAETQTSLDWTHPFCATATGTQLNITSVKIECTVNRTITLPGPTDSFWFTAVVTADATGMSDTGLVDSGVGLGVSDGWKYMRLHLIKDNGQAKVALVKGGSPDASLSINADWISGPIIVQLYRYGTTVGIKVGIKQVTDSYASMDDDDPLWMPRVSFGHLVTTTRTSTWDTLEWSISSEEVLQVPIDIKPFSRNNVIRLWKWSIIPVAIFSTEDFDAPNDIDMPSLTFGKTGDEQSLLYWQKWKHWDLNHDGLKDQVCYFWTSKTNLTVDDTEGILKGVTKDGIPIEGRDNIKIKKWK